MTKKLSNRDLNLLLVLAGILVFVLAYFLVFTPYQEKNEALDSKIKAQTSRLSELQAHYDNLATYEQGIADSKASSEAILSRIPAGLKDEDFLLYLMDMHEKAESSLTSVSFDSVSLSGQFTGMDQEQAKVFSGYRAVTSSTAVLDYSQLKAIIHHIYEDTADLTFLDSVSVTYDSGIGLLDGVFTISKLYGCFEGSEDAYVPAEVPEVSLGTKDMFGTTAVAPAAEEAPAEAPITE